MPEDFARGCKGSDRGGGFRGDDSDRGFGGTEGLDLGLGEIACADDDAGAGGQFEEDGKERHSLDSMVRCESGQ